MQILLMVLLIGNALLLASSVVEVFWRRELQAENARLQKIIEGMAARIHQQSELLSP